MPRFQSAQGSACIRGTASIRDQALIREFTYGYGTLGSLTYALGSSFLVLGMHAHLEHLNFVYQGFKVIAQSHTNKNGTHAEGNVAHL